MNLKRHRDNNMTDDEIAEDMHDNNDIVLSDEIDNLEYAYRGEKNDN